MFVITILIALIGLSSAHELDGEVPPLAKAAWERLTNVVKEKGKRHFEAMHRSRERHRANTQRKLLAYSGPGGGFVFLSMDDADMGPPASTNAHCRVSYTRLWR